MLDAVCHELLDHLYTCRQDFAGVLREAVTELTEDPAMGWRATGSTAFTCAVAEAFPDVSDQLCQFHDIKQAALLGRAVPLRRHHGVASNRQRLRVPVLHRTQPPREHPRKPGLQSGLLGAQDPDKWLHQRTGTSSVSHQAE